jgi:hypothetical protein
MAQSDHFFDLVNDKVVLNPHVINIPELKEVYTKYGIPGINYVYYMAHPESPYRNYEEDKKQEEVKKDHKGDYKPDDVEIVRAIIKVTDIYSTPKLRYYEGQKVMLDRLAAYLKNTPLDDDNQDGNFDKVIKLFEKGDKILSSFDSAEKAKEAERKGRGNTKLAYDQI